MRDIVVIAHDMRSTYNVGSLFRTADAMGVSKLWLTGYTAHPLKIADSRLPHIAEKLDKQINKTALGAEKIVKWQESTDIEAVITNLKAEGYQITALEQAKGSVKLNDFNPPAKIALLLGTELTGLTKELLDLTETTVEIPMFGNKESLNVIQAAAMALYHIRFHD